MQRSLSCIAVQPPVITQKAVLTLYRANPGREGYLFIFIFLFFILLLLLFFFFSVDLILCETSHLFYGAPLPRL